MRPLLTSTMPPAVGTMVGLHNSLVEHSATVRGSQEVPRWIDGSAPGAADSFPRTDAGRARWLAEHMDDPTGFRWIPVIGCSSARRAGIHLRGAGRRGTR